MVGPFSSTSKASSQYVSVSGQGQYNKGSPVLQGSAKGAAGNKAKYIESGAADYSNSKGQIGGFSLSGKGASLTVNQSGISPDMLTSLVGQLQTASEPQLAATPATVYAPPAQPDLSQPVSGNSTLYWAGGVVALLVLGFFFLHRK